jgi:uncharacterized protein (TIGR03083 family)
MANAARSTASSTPGSSGAELQMASNLEALGLSVEHLRALVETLSDSQLDEAAYPAEWTIADVLSHIGSGAVIMQRRLDDAVVGNATPDDFAPQVWETWNARSARAKADEALVADRNLLARVGSLSEEARSSFRLSMGPLELPFDGFVGMRLNEHALHTWDVEVAIDPTATLQADLVAYIVDNLELITRFTAKPTGTTQAIAVRTDQPRRDFSIELSPDAVTLGAGESRQPNLELPAEAFVRLVYGRLDPAHAPATVRDSGVLDELRKVFPGP